MTRRIAQANERSYVLAVDDIRPIAHRSWAIVQARVIDELTGSPPQSPVRIETAAIGFLPRVAKGGLVSLIARPSVVFPALGIPGQTYDVSFTIHAEGFIPHHVTATLTTDLLFPDRFEPFVFGAALALHRTPTTITGRVLRRSGGVLVPVANATVAVTGVWPTLPPANVSPPTAPPNIVSLAPTLYAARPATTARLRRREMTPVGGEDKILTAWSNAGDSRLPLSNGFNLAPGEVLSIDDDLAITEFISVDAVETGGDTSLPTTVTLAHPLAHSHRPGALVRRAIPQPAGPDRPLSRAATADDTCLLLDSLSGLAGAEVVEILGGDPPVLPPEFHRLRLFTTQSDPDGCYRLPPMSRIAQLEIEATEGGDTSNPVVYAPTYRTRENSLDLTLS